MTIISKVLVRKRSFSVVVRAICDERPFRIYCRISELEYVPVYNLISLKGGLNLICNPEIYVIVDEPTLDVYLWKHKTSRKSHIKNDSIEIITESNAETDFDFIRSDMRESSSFMLSDVEILQCALSIRKVHDDDPGARFRYLFVKTSPVYGRELKDTIRQVNILVKGFPEIKSNPSCEPFLEVKKLRSQTPSRSSKKRRK
ncbi:uncharacterized protein LOC117603246 isoform X2 [Osmia lignaria lignaria]|uniref:uncharacterized protein LOC117603246 isoform X2 n=1 Tax=Osmia lignaria lignaria TaxID=1437193 RepID=UPI001478280F|nr:uncharacterized protein LOC117603246 isoform X2 [Osmia lignaria]